MVTVDTFNRVISTGIIEDANTESTLKEILGKFKEQGFRELFCYDGRTTVVRQGDQTMASILIRDVAPIDILKHGSDPGFNLTCLPILFPA